jgi:hypothetical protein
MTPEDNTYYVTRAREWLQDENNHSEIVALFETVKHDLLFAACGGHSTFPAQKLDAFRSRHGGDDLTTEEKQCLVVLDCILVVQGVNMSNSSDSSVLQSSANAINTSAGGHAADTEQVRATFIYFGNLGLATRAKET